MNIDKVLGIIVSEDGIPHNFGESKEKTTAELNDNNFHDRAFEKDILNTDWFKNTGYNYDRRNNIIYNAIDMAKNGFCVIINACSKLYDGSDYNLFTIQVPESMSEELSVYLESIYEDFKRIIEEKDSLFYGYIYKDESNLDEEPYYNIDEFYNKLNINTNMSIKKSRK